MDNPQVVISFLGDITNVQQGISKIESLNGRMAQTLASQFSSASKIISQEITGTMGGKIPITNQLRQMVPELPASWKDYPTVLQKVSTNFVDVNGKLMQYNETVANVQGRSVAFGGALKNISAEAKNSEFSLSKLAQRALLVVPVWTLMREAIRGATTAFKDSVTGIIEEDTSLQRVKRGLQGTTESINVQIEKLKTTFENLAVSTGVSHEKIIGVFDTFKKHGFDLNTSLGMTIATTKFAVATFSDATSVSNVLSEAFLKIVDTSGKSGTQIEQYNNLLAMMNDITKSGKISIDDFGTSLSGIAGFAKLNNISLNDTVALLKTLANVGITGTTASSQLSTAISKVLTNLDKLGPLLGVQINPKLDSTSTIMLKVTGAMNELNKSGKNTSDISGALDKIFGARSVKVISTLAELHDKLVENMKISGSVKDLDTDFNNVNNTLGKQIDKYHQLNAEIGKTFLAGLVGAKDFAGAMVVINGLLGEMRDNASNFASIIKEAFKSPLTATSLTTFNTIKQTEDSLSAMKKQISDAEKGLLSLKDTQKSLELVKMSMKGQLDLGLGPAALGQAFAVITGQIIDQERASKNIAILQKQIADSANLSADANKKITSSLVTREDMLKLESQLRKQLQTLGTDELGIESKILEFRQSIQGVSEKDLQLQQDLVKQAAIIEGIEVRRATAKGVIDVQLEELRLRGANTVELTQARIEMERMYGLNQTRIDMIGKEVELEKEITKEKLNQNKYSSDSVKMFEIAQKYGTYTARQTQQFIRGDIGLNQFSMSSDLGKAIKEFFPQILEQKQAGEFFNTGAGKSIGVPETLSLQQKGFNPLPAASLPMPDIKTNIQAINLEIKKIFSEKDTAEAIRKSIANEIANNPQITDLINEKIDEF